MTTLKTLKRRVKESVRETAENNDGMVTQDDIHEIADISVPIHYGEILEVARHDVSLALENNGYAFTGEENPINGLACNIYYRLYNTAHTTARNEGYLK